jgi:hypothetical protein
MPPRKRTPSRAVITFYATLVLLFCVLLPWLLPGCEFEPASLKRGGVTGWHPPIGDDLDGGK